MINMQNIKGNKIEKKNNVEKQLLWIIPIITIAVIIIVVIIIIGILVISGFFQQLLAFRVDVTFDNDSNEEIIITPIGIVEGGDRVGPIYSIGLNAPYEKSKTTRFTIGINESLKIIYDGDDQNLQFVIIEFPNNDVRMMKIDADIWEDRSYYNCCWSPMESTYSISIRSELPECPEVLKPTIQGEYIEVTDELINILENL